MNHSHSTPIETNRLLLRTLEKDDDQAIFSLRSDKTVAKYVARPLQENLKEAKAFIANILDGIRNKKYLYWAIISKETATFLGTICLWHFSVDGKIAEIGYELLPKYQEKGIMTEALQAIIELAFSTLSLTNIEAFTHRKNQASIQLLQKNKFIQMKDSVDEEFKDNLIFGLRIPTTFKQHNL